jgi:hypothetical protein
MHWGHTPSITTCNHSTIAVVEHGLLQRGTKGILLGRRSGVKAVCKGCRSSKREQNKLWNGTHLQNTISVLNIGGTLIFWLFPTTGTCFSHALQTFMFVFGHFRLPHHCGLWPCWIGSACSGSCSHGNPIIAWTRSTVLHWSSAVSPYMLMIAPSCSADSGLTQPLATTYASHLTHAVCPPKYLSAPGITSCSSAQPLGHWDKWASQSRWL